MSLVSSSRTLDRGLFARHPSNELSRLPRTFHWAFADEALLWAIARGTPMLRGKGGRTLRFLVRIFDRLGFAWTFLWLVGAVQLIKLLIRQRVPDQQATAASQDYPAYFFVGFGAGNEEDLFTQYCQKQESTVARLNQLNVASFGAWHRVGIVTAFTSLVDSIRAARQAIAALPPELVSSRVEFLTFLGIRIGYFSFMRAWFKRLKEKTENRLVEVAFLAPDTTAYAAADVAIPTCYIQHGLMFYTKLLPAFTRVEALTTDEAAFFRECLPDAFVTVNPKNGNVLNASHLEKAILVASIYGNAEYMSPIASFINWAADRNLRICVRPHPRENRQFWSEHVAAGTVTIEEQDATFWRAIKRLRPRLVVSWFSTTLAEALAHGIVPVTVCLDGDRNVAGTVYPLLNRCLRWPQDAESISQLLEDDEYYADVVTRLSDGMREVGG